MSSQKGLPPPRSRFKHPVGLQVWHTLWHDWDPIGVNGFGPDDEYDGYVWPIIGKVMKGETVEQVADYLDWAVGDHMGFRVVRDESLSIARKLVTLRPNGSET